MEEISLEEMEEMEEMEEHECFYCKEVCDCGGDTYHCNFCWTCNND